MKSLYMKAYERYNFLKEKYYNKLINNPKSDEFYKIMPSKRSGNSSLPTIMYDKYKQLMNDEINEALFITFKGSIPVPKT